MGCSPRLFALAMLRREEALLGLRTKYITGGCTACSEVREGRFNLVNEFENLLLGNSGQHAKRNNHRFHFFFFFFPQGNSFDDQGVLLNVRLFSLSRII